MESEKQEGREAMESEKEEEGRGALAGMLAQRREDENVERGNWSSDVEFILASVGFAIGLGNVWRFPILMYRHGGGFFFAYWTLLVFLAFPIFFYELSLGQFTSSGPLSIFRNMAPAMEGLGWATLCLLLPNIVYYNAIHAVAIFYAFSSFGAPWADCSETAPWNSPLCYSIADYRRCVRGQPHSFYYAKGRCYDRASISLAYLERLENCILSSSSFARKPHCTLKLVLHFNATTPLEFFAPLPGGMPGQCLQKGQKALFQHYDNCTGKYVGWSGHQWNRTVPGEKLVINLGPDEQGSWAGSDARLGCLRSVLGQSRPVGSLPALAHHLAAFCRRTFRLPSQHFPDGSLGPTAACLRHVLNNYEVYSAQEYYEHFIQASKDVRDMGKKGIKHNMVLSLAFAWFLVGFGIWKGPKWTGKLVYVTAVFPIIMIIILNIISLTLDGHMDGIKYYVTFSWCKLKNRNLWVDAMSQIFFSLSVGIGGLQTLASYNRFHNNLVRDAVIVALSNCTFSFVAGFGVFGIIGHMAKQVNSEVPSVVQGGGPGLAFIIMAQATGSLPGGEILAFFFYLMLVLLAIDSAFAYVETVLTYLYDEYPRLRGHRLLVTLTLCTGLFCLGLPFVSRVGFTLIDLVDFAVYVVAVPIVVLGCVLTTFYIYGFRRYFEDMGLMFGTTRAKKFNLSNFTFNTPIKWLWRVTLLVTAPLGVLALIGINVSKLAADWDFTEPKYIATFAIGMMPLVLSLVGALVWAVVKRGLRGAALFRPSAAWGPALPAHRTGPYHTAPESSTQGSAEGGGSNGASSNTTSSNSLQA